MKWLERIFRHSLIYLPSSWRNSIVRKQVSLPGEIPSGFVFKLAETPLELEQAFRLVYSAYEPLGYCRPNPHRMRATVYHALPSTSILLALFEGEVVGTLTIVRDSLLGLPMERVFGLEKLRHGGARVAEITSLVVDPRFRRKQGGLILFPLLKYMYQYCVDYFGVDILAVAIHPKERLFYQSILMFEPVDKFKLRDYLGAPALSLFLRLGPALDLYRREFGLMQKSRNLYQFFVESEISNLLFPERDYFRINDPVVSLSYFQSLFVEKLGLDQDLNPEKMTQIRGLLSADKKGREHLRVESHARAVVTDLESGVEYLATVRDVSRGGLRLSLHDSLVHHLPRAKVRVEVSKKKYATLIVEQAWYHSQRGHGFFVSESDLIWSEFVHYLEATHVSQIGLKKKSS